MVGRTRRSCRRGAPRTVRLASGHRRGPLDFRLPLLPLHFSAGRQTFKRVTDRRPQPLGPAVCREPLPLSRGTSASRTGRSNSPWKGLRRGDRPDSGVESVHFLHLQSPEGSEVAHRALCLRSVGPLWLRGLSGTPSEG